MSEKKYLIENEKLMKEWNNDRNKDLAPNLISLGSNKKVWWICDEGHEWQASPNNRNRGRNCPYCINKKILVGYNDLETQYPKIVKEWNYNKNILKPSELGAGSNKKVWWICDEGHEWQAMINSRTYKNTSCPYCSNVKVLNGYNDLKTLYPQIAAEWNYNKNDSLPENCLVSSSKKVWWKCLKCGNEWETSIRHRTQRHQGCPKCSEELKTSFGEQAIFYYIKKEYSNVENRFLLNNKYEIDIFIKELNTGIEYDGSYFHKRRKEHDMLKENIFKKNNIKLYRIIEESNKVNFSYNNNVFIFDGRKKGELDLVIKELFKQLNIKYSDINIERDYSLICDLYLSVIKKNNILNSKLANEWNYVKNEDLKPEYISLGSTKKVWWKCSLNHEWQATVGSRTKGNGCPICANRTILKGYNDLATKKPDLINEWNYDKNSKENINIDEINPGSIIKVWWRCSTCGHEWKSAVRDRVKKNYGCPNCSIKNKSINLTMKSVKNNNSLLQTNPDLLKEWNYEKNVDITPNKISSGSHKKVWWKCLKCGNEWEAIVRDRAQKGRICPICRKEKRNR